MEFGPARRPRNLRRTQGIRDLCEESVVKVSDLIQPLFVIEGSSLAEEISSMPGQKRLSIDLLIEECRHLHASGIRGVALFPSISEDLKSEHGIEALNEDNLIYRAIREAKSSIPDLLIFADIALDPYTSHGHDGVLSEDGKDVENDATLDILSKMSVITAKMGADFVCPSDMMDFRVAAIREALDSEGFKTTGILAYTAKYNSAFYGPFRDAVGSSKSAGTSGLSKATYQMNPANYREALLEAEMDEMEGADMLMVKPAGPYLDVIKGVRDLTNLPVAAYQVSGEYAQICAAASLGWLDRNRCRDESLLSIKRAGADIILTYFAGEIAREK